MWCSFQKAILRAIRITLRIKTAPLYPTLPQNYRLCGQTNLLFHVNENFDESFQINISVLVDFAQLTNIATNLYVCKF
jgi:hypothetical protein